MEKKKKKLNGLDLYVIFSISVLVIYTIVTQVMLWKYITVNDTLTTCVYSFFGGELVTCAVIKIFKLKEEPKTNDNDEPQEPKGGGVG